MLCGESAQFADVVSAAPNGGETLLVESQVDFDCGCPVFVRQLHSQIGPQIECNPLRTAAVRQVRDLDAIDHEFSSRDGFSNVTIAEPAGVTSLGRGWRA